MRNFTFYAIAWLSLSALTASAQSLHLEKARSVAQQTSRHMTEGTALNLSGNTAQLLKKAAKHPVTETPDGELKEFSLNTEYYDPNMDEWITRDGIKSYAVIDGSTVWIKDIGTTYKYGTWIKGEISEDKKHVVFDNMQPYYEDANGNLYYISHSYTNANQDVIADTESDSFSFDYDEQTGTISNDTLELSIVNGDGGVFSYSVGYVYTPFTDKLVEVPAGLTFQNYSLRYDNAYKYYVPTLISVAWQGNDFYFKGLSTKTPNSVLKGTLQGDSIVINNGQYVGLYDDQYYLYFKGAKYTSLDSDGWPIYKSKDHAALTVSKNAAGEYQFDGKDGILFCLGKKANASYSQSYPAQTMRIFHGAPATPKTPDISGWDIDNTYKTTTTMSYIVPVEDVDGNYINPDSLFYRVFVNGKPWVFDKDWYPAFKDTLLVNSLFSDRGITPKQRTDCNGSYHVLAFDHDKSLTIDSIALQSVYFWNGEARYSGKCTYITATGNKYTDGIQAAAINNANKKVVRVSYYDLSGREIAEPRQGAYIRSIVYDDGTRQTGKFIK